MDYGSSTENRRKKKKRRRRRRRKGVYDDPVSLGLRMLFYSIWEHEQQQAD
jgi:hypothetical protein